MKRIETILVLPRVEDKPGPSMGESTTIMSEPDSFVDRAIAAVESTATDRSG